MKTNEDIQTILEKNYKKRSRVGTLKGIILTIIFMGIDVYTLYDMFLGGNFTEDRAQIYAVLGAFMLDSLPFLFGISVAHIIDVSVENNRKSFYKWGRAISGIVMFFVAALYIAIRVLIFLGGGDFNIGIQMLLGSLEWGSSYDNINAADAFSALIPIVTSAASTIVGLIFYESGADYYKQLLKETEKQKADVEAKIKNLQDGLTAEIRDIWTRLMPYRDIPPIREYDEIMNELERSFKMRQSESYQEIYKENIKIIYIEAENAINRASAMVAEYTALPDQIKAMQLDEKEEEEFSHLKKIDSTELQKIQQSVKAMQEKKI